MNLAEKATLPCITDTMVMDKPLLAMRLLVPSMRNNYPLIGSQVFTPMVLWGQKTVSLFHQ
jgi:hypothetical protein